MSNSIYRHGITIITWVGSIKTVNVSEDNKHIRADHVGDQAPECIIITKTQFLSRNRIIFINDRNYPKFEQSQDSVTNI